MTQTDKLVDRSYEPFIIIDHRVLALPLTVEAFRIYAELKKYANKDGECFPSYARLGKAFVGSFPGGHEQTLRKKAINAVQELIDWGMLRKEERSYGDTQSKASNLYVLTPASEWKKSLKQPSMLAHKSRPNQHRKKKGGVESTLPGAESTLDKDSVESTLPGVESTLPGVESTLIELDPENYIQSTRSTHKSGARVCEPKKDLASFPEPEEEKEVATETKSEQVANRSTSLIDKSENPRVANKSTHEDNSSAAAPSSEKPNNGNCWQCPQPEMRVEFLKWRSQGMGKGGTITKASNWCNKYPESANDAFAEFIESRRPPEPEQTTPDSPLQAFLTGCGDTLRGIVLNNNFTPEQVNHIAELWQAGGKREGLTMILLRKEGLID